MEHRGLPRRHISPIVISQLEPSAPSVSAVAHAKRWPPKLVEHRSEDKQVLPSGRTSPKLEKAGSKVTVRRVIAAVCEEFGISLSDIHTRRRTQKIAYPRQIAMFLLKKDFPRELSFPKIGAIFGYNHTTVFRACRKINKLIKNDTEVRAAVERVKSRIVLTMRASDDNS